MYSDCLQVNLQNCNVFINNYQKNSEEVTPIKKPHKDKFLKINIEVELPKKD